MITDYSTEKRWGKFRVEVVLMRGRHKAIYTIDVGGYVGGMECMDRAVSDIYDILAVDEKGPVMTLTDPDGDTIQIRDKKHRELTWIRNMVVSTQIIEWEPFQREAS